MGFESGYRRGEIAEARRFNPGGYTSEQLEWHLRHVQSSIDHGHFMRALHPSGRMGIRGEALLEANYMRAKGIISELRARAMTSVGNN